MVPLLRASFTLMKSLLTRASCGALLLLSTACLDISVGVRRPLPPPVVIPAPGLSEEEAATLAEIEAAARLNFDSSRVESLRAIAARPSLGPTAQVHLVNAAYRRLSFENSKVAVLQTLIHNPAFSNSARHAISAQLSALTFDSSRQTILREMNQRTSGQ